MPLPIILIAAGMMMVTMVLIVVGVSSSPRGSDQVAVRLDQFATRATPLTLEEIELSQSFGDRIMRPILQGLAGFVTRFTPARTVEATRLQLELAVRHRRAHRCDPCHSD